MQKLVHHLPWLSGFSGGGVPDARVRTRVESLTGADLSGVRVHTSPTAGALSDALGARALTVGAHVAFARDEYRPGTAMGDTLLAHELAHAAQQARGDAATLDGIGGSSGRREQLEREAADIGHRAVEGGASPRSASARRGGRSTAGAAATPAAVQLAPKSGTAPSPAPKQPAASPFVEDLPNYVDTLAEKVNADVLRGYYDITWGKPPNEIEVNVRADASQLYEGDPKNMLALNEVYPDLAAAQKAIAEKHYFTEHGLVLYTYYKGPGGSILPTLYSPRSTPLIFATMLKAVTERRKVATQTVPFLRNLAIGIAGGIVLRGVLGKIINWGGGGPTELPPGSSPPGETSPVEDPFVGTRGGTTPGETTGKVPVEDTGGAKVDPVKPAQTAHAEPEGGGTKTNEPANPAKAADEPAKVPAKEPTKGPAKAATNEPAKGPTEEPATATYKPCFLAGTEVEVDGHVTPIEDVVVGDAVLGWNAAGDAAPAAHRVGTVHRGRTRTVMRIDVGGASIYSTRAHLFHVPARGWVPAAELRAGDALTDAGAGALQVETVERVTLDDEVTTFNLTVDGVSTYFVRAGASWVLVHNGGPADFGGPLYWIFGKKPNLRPGDVDGLSSFKTTSVGEVQILMDHRVNVAGRPVGDPHFCLSEAEVQSAGLVAPPTPSIDPLAAKLPHHSLRPAGAPAYPHELTPSEMTRLGEQLNTVPKTIIKPSQIKC